MSLAHLVRTADARLRLDLVRPPAPRLHAEPAPPGRLARPLAAAAVANGLRAALARQSPSARGEWPAGRAPARLAERAPEMVPAAERALAFATSAAPPSATLAAERALQLARLEAVVRTGYVDARIGEAEDPEDVAEVASMLARIPWGELGASALPPPLFPSFGEALPDAEPDALAGATLLAVSASRAARVDDDEVRALVARVVIARAEWGPAVAAARVREVGVLLARHGLLWRAPVAPLVAHEAFPAVEAWFLAELKAARREAAPADAEERAPRRAPMPRWAKQRYVDRTPGTRPEGKAAKKKGATAPRDAPQEGSGARSDPTVEERRDRASRRGRGR